jgi:hypothetical protein
VPRYWQQFVAALLRSCERGVGLSHWKLFATPEGHRQHTICPLLGHRVVLAIQLAKCDRLGVESDVLDSILALSDKKVRVMRVSECKSTAWLYLLAVA